MSGLVPSTGLVRKLYEDAQDHDIEYRSSAFWQAILQTYFKIDDNFISLCEYSPDEGRNRTDITVLRYDANHHTLAILKVLEAKRQGSSAKAAEKDVLLSALKVIDKYKMVAIYAMTTWQTKFRVWFVDAKKRKLEPLDEGEDQPNQKDAYIDADSAEAVSFQETVRFMKGEPPLRMAPVVPSQAYDMNDSSLYGDASASFTDPSFSMWSEGQQTQIPDAGVDFGYTPQEGVNIQSMPDTSKSGGREKTVKLTRKKHTFGSDELTFRRGKASQSTQVEEWEWVEDKRLWRWKRSRETDYYAESIP